MVVLRGSFFLRSIWESNGDICVDQDQTMVVLGQVMTIFCLLETEKL